MVASPKFITVFVPAYNGADYIKPLIESVLTQELPKGYQLEFLITDSGSRDETVSIIKEHPSVILDQIPNSDYGHGKTRQAAARRARGEYILFLSQDATPAHNRWLINMIEPFKLSDKIGCVFGRQIPRPFAVPTIKREVAGVFGGIGAPDSIVIHRYKSLIDNYQTNELNSFFSDVNSAIRKDLVEKIPFRDVRYAEDQALAEDIQKGGFYKAYSPSGAVWHSNEYTFSEYYYRKFDEYTGLLESTDIVLNKSLKSLLFGWIGPSIDDLHFTIHDREYNKRAKIKFILQIPLYNFALQLGRYNAIKYLKDARKRKKLSLESRRNTKA